MRSFLKQVPVYLVIYWIISTLLLNKDSDFLSINFLGLPLRHTHYIIILLALFSLKDLNISLLKKNIFFLLFNLIGLILLVKSRGTNLRFVLGSYGIFFFSLFYFFTKIHFTKKTNIIITVKTIIIFCFLGDIVFIIKYFLLNHYTLPIGIHLSSDVLPIVAATCIFLIWGFKLDAIKFYRYAIYLFLASIVLVKIKGVLFAMLISYLFYISDFKKKLLVYSSMFILFFLVSKFILPPYFFSFIFFEIKDLNFLTGGQLLNVGTRLLLWDEVTNKIASNLFLGNGFTPINCYPIDYFWQNVVGSISKNVNPHNSYFLLTFYGGFLSFFLFFKFIFDLKWSLLDLSKEFIAIFSGVIVIMVCALTTPVYEIYYLAPFFWIYVALLKIYSENDQIMND